MKIISNKPKKIYLILMNRSIFGIHSQRNKSQKLLRRMVRIFKFSRFENPTVARASIARGSREMAAPENATLPLIKLNFLDISRQTLNCSCKYTCQNSSLIISQLSSPPRALLVPEDRRTIVSASWNA